MPSELTFLAALLVGFLGSTHCIGMCSGIAGTVGASTATNPSFLERSSYLLLYNVGRISSYVVAGLIAGAIGQIGLGVFPEKVAHSIAMVISIAFLIALGSYLAGWWSFLPKLELVGSRLWRIIEPWGRKLLPVRNRYQAFLFGCIWGWLPCGLVYSVLAWAVVGGSIKQGALLMLGLGLGTLPTVLCLGMAGQTLRRLRSNALVRQAAGLSLVLFAVGMFVVSQLNQHEHNNTHVHASAELQALD